MTDKLNQRQLIFVGEYLRTGNGKQSAITAGYSARTAEPTASRLLRNVKVAAAIRKEQAALSERTQIDQAWVLEKLVAIVENGMQKLPLLAKDGSDTGLTALFDTTGALGGLDKIAKILGLYSERIDHHMFVEEVRELARAAGVDEAEAIAEAESWLAQQR